MHIFVVGTTKHKYFRVRKKRNNLKFPIFIYRGEYLAVRNADGAFYLCQAHQQIYKTSKKIRVQWLSEKPEANPNNDIYIKEHYDRTGKHIS